MGVVHALEACEQRVVDLDDIVIAELDYCVAAETRAEDEGVVAVAAIQDVVSDAAIEHVTAISGVKRVIAGPAEQQVAAIASPENVVPGAAEQSVAAVAAG